MTTVTFSRSCPGEPSDVWRRFLAEYWRHPATFSSGFRSSVLEDITGDRAVLTRTTVEDFEKNLKGVFEDAVKDANRRPAALEAAQEQEIEHARQADAQRRERIVEERRRAEELTPGS